MKRFRLLIITLILFFNYFSSTDVMASAQIVTPKNNKYDILVDLTELKLYLLNAQTHKVIKSYPVAGGKECTPSPLGTWIIVNKKSGWGKGFGTRWMQLNVPWGKYGIHGTNKPSSIGNPESMGCIRMLNNDVEDLYGRVSAGTVVVIYGGPYGLSYNKFRTLKNIYYERYVNTYSNYQMNYLINPITKEEKKDLYTGALYAFIDSTLDNRDKNMFYQLSKEINTILNN